MYHIPLALQKVYGCSNESKNGNGEEGREWRVPGLLKARERKVAGAIKSLFNARDLQLECARVLHEALLVSVLLYGSETMIWEEKEKSRIRAVQMDNLRDLLGIRRMNRVPNE